MGVFASLFGTIATVFGATQGAEAAIAPPKNDFTSTDVYGSGGESMWGDPPKWEARVEKESTPSSSPEL